MDHVARHFDYVLGPTQDSRLASVAAGQSIEGLVLGLETDAPFILRSRALRVALDSDELSYVGLNHVLARWYGPDRNYTSQNLVRQSLLSPYFGQLGNPIPVLRQFYYPPGSEIRVDITNDGTMALTNLTFYFRGIKLYRPGAVKAYTYPSRFGVLPFTYPQIVPSLAVTTGAPGVFRTFQCKTDADFVLQALQGGLPFNDTAVSEVFVTLRDEDEKPYSNAPVHIDVLAGNAGTERLFPFNGNQTAAPVAAGPNSPGLVFPEIYIPKNHVFYYNVQRADASFGGAVAVDFPIQFIGQKVFDKS